MALIKKPKSQLTQNDPNSNYPPFLRGTTAAKPSNLPFEGDAFPTSNAPAKPAINPNNPFAGGTQGTSAPAKPAPMPWEKPFVPPTYEKGDTGYAYGASMAGGSQMRPAVNADTDESYQKKFIAAKQAHSMAMDKAKKDYENEKNKKTQLVQKAKEQGMPLTTFSPELQEHAKQMEQQEAAKQKPVQDRIAANPYDYAGLATSSENDNQLLGRLETNPESYTGYGTSTQEQAPVEPAAPAAPAATATPVTPAPAATATPVTPAPAATATPVTPAMIAPRKPMAATSFIQAPARQGVPTYTPNANRNFANKETIPEGQARLVANSRVAGRTDDASRQALQSVDMNAGNTLTPAQQASNERLAREASMRRATGETLVTPEERAKMQASGDMDLANANLNAARARQDANPQAESEADKKYSDEWKASQEKIRAERHRIDEFRIAHGGTEQMGVKEATRLMRQQEREDQQARLIAANSPAGLQEKKNEGVVEGAKVKAGAMVTAAGIKAETEAAKIGVSSDKLQEAIRHNQATEQQAANALDLNRDVAEDKNLNAKELLKQSALRLEIYRNTQQEDVALKRSLTAFNNAKTSELSKDDALQIAHQEADIYGRLAAKEMDEDKRNEYLEKAGKAISEAKNLNSKKPAAPAGTPATPASSRKQNPQTGKWWIFENGQWKEEG